MAKAQASPVLWSQSSPDFGQRDPPWSPSMAACDGRNSRNGSLMLSPPMGPRRMRALSGQSSECASFLLDDGDSAAIQQAIDESLADDTRRRMGTALQDTFQELCREYPDAMASHDVKRARRKSSEDLDAIVEDRQEDLSAGSSPEKAATDVAGRPGQEFLWHDGLVDHEQLMAAIYASQGLDFSETQNRAQRFLDTIGLKAVDLGVKNYDEQGRELLNQCFYLSIARCYLGAEARTTLVNQTGLLLKRTIEAAVLQLHPEWRDSARIGDEAMAFADFLPMAMHSQPPSLLSGMAVVVLDSTAGHVEVFLGPRYEEIPEREEKVKGLVLLWYTPGHYQALVSHDASGSRPDWTYSEFKAILEAEGVMYIETLE